MEFNRDASEYNTPFKDSGIRYGGIFSRNNIEAWVNSITMILSIFNNPLHTFLGTGRIGLEHLHYLNKDENEMRLNFDGGDNNDGITIIDTVSGKYCFMIINDYQCEENGRKPYEILSAVEYARDFYYPVDIKKCSEYDKEIFKGEKLDAELFRRKKNLEIIEKSFEDFPVLTTKELLKIWPNYKSNLQQSNNNTVLTEKN